MNPELSVESPRSLRIGRVASVVTAIALLDMSIGRVLGTEKVMPATENILDLMAYLGTGH